MRRWLQTASGWTLDTSRVRRWAKPMCGYRAGLKQKKQKVPKEAEFELRNWAALGLARTPCKKYRETPSDTRRVRLCVTWGLSVFVTWAPVAAEARPIRTGPYLQPGVPQQISNFSEIIGASFNRPLG